MVNFLPQIYVQIWTTLELPPSSPVPVAAPWHCTHAGCPSAAAALAGPRVAPGCPRVGAELSVCPRWHSGSAAGLRGLQLGCSSGGDAWAAQVCQDRMTLQKCFDQNWAKRVYSSHTLCREALSLVPANRKPCHGRKRGGRVPPCAGTGEKTVLC